MMQRAPIAALIASILYVAGPLSFLLVFHGTTSAAPYPAERSLALDAAITLLFAGAGLAVQLVLSRGRRLRDVPLIRPLTALAALTGLMALAGVARGHALRYVATDIVPIAELVVMYL